MRTERKFFAAAADGELVLKLDADRVQGIVAAGHGRAFSSSGRLMKEWVYVRPASKGGVQALRDGGPCFCAPLRSEEELDMEYATPLTVARRYHDAWTAGRYADAQGCLTPDLETDVPINTYANAGEWMSAVARTRELARDVEILGEYCNEDEALQLYDMVIDPPIGTLRIAEQFMVKDGRIIKIRHVHDTHTLRTAQAGSGADGVAGKFREGCC